jgi:hypothetical protein
MIGADSGRSRPLAGPERGGGRVAERRRLRRRQARRQALRRRRRAASLALAAALALAGATLSGAWSSAGGAGAPARGGRQAGPSARLARANTAATAPARSGPSSATASTTRTRRSPGSLPQTHAFPSAGAARFKSLMASLWAGIVHDSVKRAQPAFFPKRAYLQLKAISGASSDWTNRLLHDFALDIAAAHALLGRHPLGARLLRVEVDRGYGHWIEPGVCYNSIGYYEMPNARVLYRQQGRTRSFGIASMISWRGIWYVVHLGAVLRSSDVGVVDEPSLGPGVSVYSGTC